MPAPKIDDPPAAKKPDASSLRKLRVLCALCLLLGSYTLARSVVQLILDDGLQIDPTWFFIGASGGLLAGRKGWRTFVLIFSWIFLVASIIGIGFLLYESRQVRGLNFPEWFKWLDAVQILIGAIFAWVSWWAIRLLRQPDVKAAFSREQPFDIQLTKFARCSIWLAALAIAFGITLPLTKWWRNDVVQAGGGYRGNSDGVRYQAVEIFYLYGRVQALAMSSSESTAGGMLTTSSTGKELPRATLNRPDGIELLLPATVNIFEIVDGNYREAFLDLTEEEAEEYLEQATIPYRINDLKQFISERRQTPSIPP